MDFVSGIVSSVISGLITELIKSGVKSITSKSLDKKIKSELEKSYVLNEKEKALYIERIKNDLIRNGVMSKSLNNYMLNRKNSESAIQAIKQMSSKPSDKILSNRSLLNYFKSKKK